MTTASPAAAIPEATVAEVVIPAAPIAETQEAVTPAAAVTVEAPEETAAAPAEVTWIWSGHRICCSPAHAIDHIGLFRGSPEK